MQRYYLWQDVPNRNEHKAEMCEADDGDYVLYTDAQARISQLEAALREYGRHKSNCNFRVSPQNTREPGLCSCGLHQALSPK